jgi:hypothetical protein
MLGIPEVIQKVTQHHRHQYSLGTLVEGANHVPGVLQRPVSWVEALAHCEDITPEQKKLS